MHSTFPEVGGRLGLVCSCLPDAGVVVDPVLTSMTGLGSASPGVRGKWRPPGLLDLLSV